MEIDLPRCELSSGSTSQCFTSENLLTSRTHFAVSPNEAIGRAVVVELRSFCRLKLGQDALRQRFAQFDTPLVKAVDIPDGSLSEDAVFV